MKDKRLYIFLFLFVALEIVLLNSRGVWAPDEARYARVAYEMKEKQSFLIPYLNGEIYREKPPLFFDLTILFSLFSKTVPHYSVKVVSLFSAVLVIFLSMAVANKLGSKMSLLVPIILIATPKFLWQSQFGQIDMLLCAFVLLQFFIGISMLDSEKISAMKILLLGLASFAAIISKGPAGVLPVFISLIALSFYTKKYKVIAPFFASLFTTLILSSIWLYSSALFAGWEYPKSLIFKQTLTRYLEPWHHHAPFYYYLEVIWADGFPFVFFFVPAVIHFFKKRWYEEKRFFYSFAFISVYILFFSISSGKRSVYILPIYPMIAIFLSFAIEQWHIKEFPKKWLISVSLLIAVIPLTTIPFLLKRVNFTLSFEVTLLIFALISYSLGCLTFIYIFVKRELFLPQIFAIFSLLLLFSAIPSVISIDKIKVPYDFVSSAKPLTKCGVKVGVYPSLIPSVNFYLESNTVVFKKLEEEKAIDFVIKGNLLLSKENETPENIRMISTVLWKGQIGDDNYFLLASY